MSDSQYALDLDNVELLIHQTLPCLPRQDQLLVLRVLALTLVVDGSISYKERNYMITALEACGCAPNVGQLLLTTKKYANGRLTYDDYKSMFADLHDKNPEQLSQQERRYIWRWQVQCRINEFMMRIWTIF
mmetsp:Transcript_32754/g.80692  ORF Transcript_32754/g.80692 Transcript_32754/m.80692 type:complete len:131 (-) Transcript_32754:157-549(-)